MNIEKLMGDEEEDEHGKVGNSFKLPSLKVEDIVVGCVANLPMLQLLESHLFP